MVITILDNWVRLKLSSEEPIGILTGLQDYLSYNDTDHRYNLLQKARGEEPEINHRDIKQLNELAYMATDRYYQNFLCYTINLVKGTKNTLRNFITNDNFLKLEMSLGDRAVITIDFGRKSTRIRPGLLRLVLLYLQDSVEEDYGIPWDFTIEEKRQNKVYLTKNPVYGFQGINLRPEQKEAIDTIRRTLSDTENLGYLFNRAMLDLSVNFGKTFTLYILSKNFTKEDGTPAPVIWFFQDRELLAKAVYDYIGLEPELGVLASDKTYVAKYLSKRGVDLRPTYNENKPFTLAMIQTLDARFKAKKLTARDLKYFLVGSYDECHKSGNDRAERVLDRFRFGFLVGASGSPTASMSGANRYSVTGTFGTIRHRITFKDTVELGRSLPLEVWRMINPIPVTKPTSAYNVGKIKEYGVYNSDHRYNLLKFALDYSVNDERQTLIYGGNMQIKYLKSIYDKLILDGFDLEFTTGDDVNRIDKISSFSNRKTEILFSNTIVGTGIDIPTIGSLIYLVPTDNQIDVMQAPIGRLGRVFNGEGKPIDMGIIWDFYDDDTYVSKPDLFGKETEDPIPGELTRISQIRHSYYTDQNIPIIDKTPF